MHKADFYMDLSFMAIKQHWLSYGFTPKWLAIPYLNNGDSDSYMHQ